MAIVLVWSAIGIPLSQGQLLAWWSKTRARQDLQCSKQENNLPKVKTKLSEQYQVTEIMHTLMTSKSQMLFFNGSDFLCFWLHVPKSEYMSPAQTQHNQPQHTQHGFKVGASSYQTVWTLPVKWTPTVHTFYVFFCNFSRNWSTGWIITAADNNSRWELKFFHRGFFGKLPFNIFDNVMWSCWWWILTNKYSLTVTKKLGEIPLDVISLFGIL